MAPAFSEIRVSTKQWYEAHLWSALTYVVLREDQSAEEFLAVVGRDEPRLIAHTRRLWRAIDQLRKISRMGESADLTEFERCCVELQANAQAGVAMMLEALQSRLATGHLPLGEHAPSSEAVVEVGDANG
ncbi:MAG TPA: hypothetical protein VME66_04175 [Candidatus Acidoferrales bacterium]|nr:hypothetical protein [Candidatus Acidoferrales bacterium]